MHYRNGREAKNGDRIVQIGGDGKINCIGVLHSAVPGNDYCNGQIAVVHGPTMACMVDCLNLEDVETMLKERDLHKRPAGK